MTCHNPETAVLLNRLFGDFVSPDSFSAYPWHVYIAPEGYALTLPEGGAFDLLGDPETTQEQLEALFAERYPALEITLDLHGAYYVPADAPSPGNTKLGAYLRTQGVKTLRYTEEEFKEAFPSDYDVLLDLSRGLPDHASVCWEHRPGEPGDNWTCAVQLRNRITMFRKGSSPYTALRRAIQALIMREDENG